MGATNQSPPAQFQRDMIILVTHHIVPASTALSTTFIDPSAVNIDHPSHLFTYTLVTDILSTVVTLPDLCVFFLLRHHILISRSSFRNHIAILSRVSDVDVLSP